MLYRKAGIIGFSLINRKKFRSGREETSSKLVRAVINNYCVIVFKTTTEKEKMNLPKTKEVTLYICIDTSFNENRLVVFPNDMSGYDDYTLIDTQTVTVDIPQNINIKALQVEKLQQSKKELLAKTEIAAKEIDEKIQSLMCIEAK